PDTPGHQFGDGDNAVLQIQLLGSNAGPHATGLVIGETAGGTTIKGLVIGNFDGPAIRDDAAASATIAGNFIVTHPSRTRSSPNATETGYTGAIYLTDPGGVLRVPGSTVLTIGGVDPAGRNVISGNGGTGIKGEGRGEDLLIEGNFIGTDATGTQPLGNADGG